MRWVDLFFLIPIGKYIFFTSKNAISDEKASYSARGLWRHWLEWASIIIKMACNSNLSSQKKPKQLGKYCVAGGPGMASCKNNSLSTGISMHLFPKSNEKLRNLWVKFVQRHRPDWHASAYSALCSAHFENHCFTQRLDTGLEIGNNSKTKWWLNKDAYPTVDTVVPSQTTREISDREHRKVCKYKFTIGSGLYINILNVNDIGCIKSMLISRYIWYRILSRCLLDFERCFEARYSFDFNSQRTRFCQWNAVCDSRTPERYSEPSYHSRKQVERPGFIQGTIAQK